MITPLAWLERNPTYKEMKEELVAERPLDVRFSRLSGPSGGGHHHVQGLRRSGRRRSASPCGADARDRPPLQFSLRRDLSHPRAAPCGGPETPGHRRAEDEQVLRQCDLHERSGRRPEEEGRGDVHRSPAAAQKRSRAVPNSAMSYTFHGLYSPPETVAEIAPACRSAAIGCTECKRRLAEAIAEGMKPIHERRDHYLGHPEEVRAIIEDGNVRAARNCEGDVGRSAGSHENKP